MICANPISKESAQKIAEEFMTQKAASRGVKRAARMQAVKALQWNVQTSDTSLYLFNASDGNGFVIVSGDDRTEPILGYSDIGTIDTENIPQNMRSWLQHYADEIAIIQKYNLRNVRRSVATCGPAIEKQLTCLWNQGAPYNLLCPMVEQYKDEACTITYKPAGQAVTGCAATALAQVLYMHQDATVLLRDIEARKDVVHNSISRESGEMVWQKFSDSAIPAGTAIDWANIRPMYNGEEELNDDEKLAISNLMHVCGGAMNMIYGLGDEFEGSTAMGEDGVKAACFYLGYDHAAAHFQDCYPYQEWLQLLYDELKVAKAVYFGGVSSGSGHAFVIDGYDKEDLFHINWGWSGVANEAPDNGGYYHLNMAALDEEGNTIGTMPCGREMYYVEADGTFDVKYAIGSSLPEGRYRLFVSSNMLEVEGTVCTFTVTNAPTGIHTVRSVTDRTDKFEYNLKGQRTDGTYKGITIRNGKKIINR